MGGCCAIHTYTFASRSFNGVDTVDGAASLTTTTIRPRSGRAGHGGGGGGGGGMTATTTPTTRQRIHGVYSKCGFDRRGAWNVVCERAADLMVEIVLGRMGEFFVLCVHGNVSVCVGVCVCV